MSLLRVQSPVCRFEATLRPPVPELSKRSDPQHRARPGPPWELASTRCWSLWSLGKSDYSLLQSNREAIQHPRKDQGDNPEGPTERRPSALVSSCRDTCMGILVPRVHMKGVLTFSNHLEGFDSGCTMSLPR